MKLFQIQGFKLLVAPHLVREKLLKLLPQEVASEFSERLALLLTPPITDTPSTRATMASTSHLDSLPTSLKVAHTTPSRPRSPQRRSTGRINEEEHMKRRRIYDSRSHVVSDRQKEGDGDGFSYAYDQALENKRNRKITQIVPDSSHRTKSTNGSHTAPPKCSTVGEVCPSSSGFVITRGSLDQCSEISEGGGTDMTFNTMVSAARLFPPPPSRRKWEYHTDTNSRRRLSCDEAMLDMSEWSMSRWNDFHEEKKAAGYRETSACTGGLSMTGNSENNLSLHEHKCREGFRREEVLHHRHLP
eukprot:Blabericola_migrator_1__1020@NODE_1257_length_4964_cov_22_802736_g850_i0_p2_GENE_NODE_1257_length_4964_cov_22_802736_g850_i0NODE_1257_length_4964_cov_22_802736_g850_i0_p2_ORF_typecomplete_len301_score41_04_NODE_1257_length_4964_cov_22_802736_g850_i029213823